MRPAVLTLTAFPPADEAGNPRHTTIVRGDNETNLRRREAGTVRFNTII